jgi:hypothetical protein
MTEGKLKETRDDEETKMRRRRYIGTQKHIEWIKKAY